MSRSGTTLRSVACTGVVALAMALIAGCANATQSADDAPQSRPQSASPNQSTQEAAMTDRIQIVQGRQASSGEVQLGLVNVFDGQVHLSLAHGQGDAWVERLVLARGDIFAAGGRLLRVEEIGSDGQSGRASVTLAEFPAPAGIAAPAAGHAVVVEGGQLQLGELALRATAISANEATLEAWPHKHPREKADPAEVRTQTVAPGGSLDLGTASMRVTRLQPAAGEVRGFVELSAGE